MCLCAAHAVHAAKPVHGEKGELVRDTPTLWVVWPHNQFQVIWRPPASLPCPRPPACLPADLSRFKSILFTCKSKGTLPAAA